MFVRYDGTLVVTNCGYAYGTVGVQESAGKRKREGPVYRAVILAIGFKAIQGSLAVKLLGVLCKELQRY